MRYITIDLEGDGLNREENRKLFPEGNHFDTGTIIWCCSIYDGKKSAALVKKLPPQPRPRT